MTEQKTQGRLKMSDGFELFYRHWKPIGEPKRVILGLHGSGWHSGQFRYIGERLSVDVPGTELYAVDRRGFGNSVEDRFQRGAISSLKRYRQDIGEIAESIRNDHPDKKFYLFGHSEGSVHALFLAASHPDSVDGLILAGPPISIKVKLPRSLLLRIVFLRIFFPSTIIDTLRYRSEEQKQSDETASVQEDPLSAHSKYSPRFLFGFRFARTVPSTARKVRTPTLILQGDADGLVAPEGAARLLEMLGASDKSLKTFPQADHHFYDTLPPRQNSKYDEVKKGQVIVAIADWLKTH